MASASATVDGLPLASWGGRVLAWLLDALVILAAGTLVVLPWMVGFVQRLALLLEERSHGVVTPGEDVAIRLGLWDVMPWVGGWLVGILVYAVAFPMWRGQTPGKAVKGISVRRASVPGPLPFWVAVRRVVLPMLYTLPAGGIVVAALDGCWPLWDERRQALHDKMAGTQVVVGRQVRG